MSKTKIYIDFEAISSPFNRGFGASEDWPFTYSIGTFKGTDFKTKTFIMNFKSLKSRIKESQIEVNNIYEDLKINLEKDLKELIKTNSLDIAKVEFVAWAGELERRVLKKLFGNDVTVVDQNTQDHISLKIITAKDIPTNLYFENFRKDVLKNIEEKFYKSRGLEYDGALAALAGYILLLTQTNRKGKFFFKTDEKKLIDELRTYSLDDIKRMELIHKKGPKWFAAQIKINVERNTTISSLSKAIARDTKLHNSLSEFDENMSIVDLKKIIKKSLDKNAKDLAKIKDKK